MKITALQLARELKKDRRTVTNWFNETPALPSSIKARQRVVDLEQLLDWWAARAVRQARAAWEKERPADTEQSMKEARTRKEIALAMKAELEIGELRGELLPLSMHEERVAQLCERLAGRVKTIGRYRGDVQRSMTDLDASQLLDRIIDELLRSLMSVADEIEDPPVPETQHA